MLPSDKKRTPPYLSVSASTVSSEKLERLPRPVVCTSKSVCLENQTKWKVKNRRRAVKELFDA